MLRFEWVFPALFLGLAGAASAGPVPWFKWRSVSGEVVCAQTSPGAAWTRIEQAFVDPRCQRRDLSSDSARTAGKK